jgi:hypothetical protein
MEAAARIGYSAVEWKTLRPSSSLTEQWPTLLAAQSERCKLPLRLHAGEPTRLEAESKLQNMQLSVVRILADETDSVALPGKRSRKLKHVWFAFLLLRRPRREQTETIESGFTQVVVGYAAGGWLVVIARATEVSRPPRRLKPGQPPTTCGPSQKLARLNGGDYWPTVYEVEAELERSSKQGILMRLTISRPFDEEVLFTIALVASLLPRRCCAALGSHAAAKWFQKF